MATEPAKTSSQKTHKNHHITNIRYPYAKTWDKRNTSIEFELANVHFSTSNAIRRLMLSHVKTVGFRTEPYKECDINVIVNDTPVLLLPKNLITNFLSSSSPTFSDTQSIILQYTLVVDGLIIVSKVVIILI